MGIFNPKWMKDHKETNKLKDPEKLKRAALKGKTDKVRDMAVERLYVVNRDAFDDLVKHAPDSSVRRHAVSYMCIKEGYGYKKGFIPVLQEIAKNDDDEGVQKIVASQLAWHREQERKANRTPEEVEKETLQEALSGWEKAIEKLQSDESLVECALRCRTHEQRRTAIYWIKDDATLAKLALRYVELDARQEYLAPDGIKYYRDEAYYAVGRIRSQKILDELAHHRNRTIRVAALENKNCSETLRKEYLAKKQLEKSQRLEYGESRVAFTDDGDINAP